ncbi:MAG: peptide chain release factor N(5)-glutamine methyltransferase [Kiritimatiellaeota bacterium]|nr:peptide chain release factor N(5)-glutamine methyltransferase [Kiritimatiellota bacterium]
MKTLGEILRLSHEFLATKGIAESRLAAEYLAARLLKCKRLELPLRHGEVLAEPLVEAMRRGVKRVATGEPVQYVIGCWEFRGRSFLTDRRALIPRPETEQLVDLVLRSRQIREGEHPRVVDVGTGTGCIALSIAAECPNAKVLATDVSEEALSLARDNADRLGLAHRVTFVSASLDDILEPATVDILVSNPPYIPSKAVDALSPTVRDFEPRLALDGGEDGMDILNAIAEEATFALRGGGALFLELSAEHAQAHAMTRTLTELGFEQIAPHRDFNNAERFLSATLAEGL